MPRHARGRADVEKRPAPRDEGAEIVQDPAEVLRAALGLGIVGRVLDLAVEGKDEFGLGVRIGEDVPAVFTGAEVPDLAVFAVRDPDLVLVEAGDIEIAFSPGTEARSAAGGAARRALEPVKGVVQTGPQPFGTPAAPGAFAKARATAALSSAGVNGLGRKSQAPIFRAWAAPLSVG